jgi:hypothetical protein
MYSRERCGLCDEARHVIMAVRERLPFEYREIRIDGDEELERAYGLRVPVVLIGGIEWFETSVEEGALAAALAR